MDDVHRHTVEMPRDEDDAVMASSSSATADDSLQPSDVDDDDVQTHPDEDESAIDEAIRITAEALSISALELLEVFQMDDEEAENEKDMHLPQLPLIDDNDDVTTTQMTSSSTSSMKMHLTEVSQAITQLQPFEPLPMHTTATPASHIYIFDFDGVLRDNRPSALKKSPQPYQHAIHCLRHLLMTATRNDVRNARLMIASFNPHAHAILGDWGVAHWFHAHRSGVNREQQHPQHDACSTDVTTFVEDEKKSNDEDEKVTTDTTSVTTTTTTTDGITSTTSSSSSSNANVVPLGPMPLRPAVSPLLCKATQIHDMLCHAQSGYDASVTQVWFFDDLYSNIMSVQLRLPTVRCVWVDPAYGFTPNHVAHVLSSSSNTTSSP